MSYQEYIVRVYQNKTEWLNKEGKLHRVDGPAVEFADGYKAWYLEGKRHRVDGPAVEDANGYKSWYLEGKLHRVDGPAVEYGDGYKAWYLEGKLYSEAEFKQKMQVPSCDGKVIEFEGKKYKLIGI